MLGDREAHFGQVEELPAVGGDYFRLIERRPTAGAGLGRVCDEAVGVRRLLEGRAAVAGLAADPSAGLLAEAAGAGDFLPGRVGRGRQVRVVGVARDRGTALDLTFEFADASAELVGKLLLLDELRGLRGERRLGPGEFLREPRDERLLGASDAGFGVRDAALDLFEVAQHGARALRIKTEEVSLVDHKVGSDAELGKRIGGRMVVVNRSAGMEVLYSLVVAGYLNT
jgi:hypothetical protein